MISMSPTSKTESTKKEPWVPTSDPTWWSQPICEMILATRSTWSVPRFSHQPATANRKSYPSSMARRLWALPPSNLAALSQCLSVIRNDHASEPVETWSSVTWWNHNIYIYIHTHVYMYIPLMGDTVHTTTFHHLSIINHNEPLLLRSYPFTYYYTM